MRYSTRTAPNTMLQRCHLQNARFQLVPARSSRRHRRQHASTVSQLCCAVGCRSNGRALPRCARVRELRARLPEMDSVVRAARIWARNKLVHLVLVMGSMAQSSLGNTKREPLYCTYGLHASTSHSSNAFNKLAVHLLAQTHTKKRGRTNLRCNSRLIAPQRCRRQH